MGIPRGTTAASLVMAGMAILILAGCGGGGTGGSACTLGGSTGCGGTLPLPPTTTPVTPPIVTPQPPSPDPAASAAALSLVFSSNELKSAGGAPVTVTALVKNAANVALANATISFAADSGLLSGAQAATDAGGRATALLDTGGQRNNRNITVSARVGTRTASGVVAVAGTSALLDGPPVLARGQHATLTLTVRDAAGQPVAGVPYTASTAHGNAVTPGPAAQTDGMGRAILTLQAGTAGTETVTVTAAGASASHAVAISDAFTLTPAVAVDAAGAEVLPTVNTGACQPVDAHYAGSLDAGATVLLTTSRGRVYADSACSQPLSTTLPMTAGAMRRAYVASSYAGVATLTAAIAGGPGAVTKVAFVAPLTPAATVSLQADHPVMTSNSAGQQGQRSRLLAVVRDGTAANNLVSNAVVVFSIVGDASGGILLPPSTASTGDDGMAMATYVAGGADSGRDGVTIQASIAGLSGAGATASTHLTVSRQAMSIQFGTGNHITDYSPSLLQQQFSVLLADAAGNAVAGQPISATAWIRSYSKGEYVWQPDKAAGGDAGLWVPVITYTCANEDRLRTGLYDPALDTNGNGRLDPGIPVTVTVQGPTDAQGLAIFTVNYPRDRGNWLVVELTVRAIVSGTEAVATTNDALPALTADLERHHVSPPGQVSPYGVNACNQPD
ncbi:MAG TPA: Ig-like domain-containing protein [Burkholderiaceae bacterium]|nr:Ig-like domain-containing protein [Burkholderiaceae bacterium]